jgi:hypothetical protein
MWLFNFARTTLWFQSKSIEQGDDLPAILKNFASFATLLVTDEEPTQAQCNTGAMHNYKMIFCWTMQAMSNYFYQNNMSWETTATYGAISPFWFGGGIGTLHKERRSVA